MTCVSRAARRESGFSLLESLLACTLLTVGVLALAAVFAVASALGARARHMTLAAILAAQTIEELSASRAAGDVVATDFTGPSGERLAGGGGSPPPGTAFIRRWSVRERSDGVGRSVVMTVSVESLRSGSSGIPDVRLVTARARLEP